MSVKMSCWKNCTGNMWDNNDSGSCARLPLPCTRISDHMGVVAYEDIFILVVWVVLLCPLILVLFTNSYCQQVSPLSWEVSYLSISACLYIRTNNLHDEGCRPLDAATGKWVSNKHGKELFDCHLIDLMMHLQHETVWACHNTVGVQYVIQHTDIIEMDMLITKQYQE